METEVSKAILQSAAELNEKNKMLKEQNQKLRKKCSQLGEAYHELESRLFALQTIQPTYLKIERPDREDVDLGLSHHTLPKVLNALKCGLNVYLYGPSGSGKTFAAKQCADALNVKLYFTGAISNEYKLTGFMDAKGEYVSTEFRKAYEDGGLFLFDEIDGSFPQAVLAFNAALANDYMDFPDKRVPRNKNFYCIAAANTIGLGANRQYVGRNQLDAASLDRFVFIEWDYDLNMERKITNNDEWFEYVLKARKAVESMNLRHIISPRASIFGAKLLENRFSRKAVEDMVLWKGMDSSTMNQIKEYIAPVEIHAGNEKEGTARFGKINIYYDEYDAITARTNFSVKRDQPILNIVSKDGRYCKQEKATIDGIITYKVTAGQTVKRGDVIATISRV